MDATNAALDSVNDFLSDDPTGTYPLETLSELTERQPVAPRCDHAAAKASRGQWELLQFVGIQQDWDDSGNEAPLALRNCECGTTLARSATAVDLIDESIRQQQLALGRARVTRDIRPSAIRAEKLTVRAEAGQ